MADELVADLEQSVINLIGSVQINRLNSKVLAKRAEIWLENYNKKLKYYELNDDIRLYEKFKDKAGRTIERKGFAEKLEGISSEKITILSGAPRVLQGKDIIKGTKIILREDSDLVEVEDSNTRFSLEKDNKEKK
jgi:lipopolysaccharide export system protein LptA